MKKIVLILTLLLPWVVTANCLKHPIYCQIKKNKPSMDNNKAMKLSNMISRSSRKFKIPSRIYTAILMQESAYKTNSFNKSCGITDLNSTKVVCVINDIGISQVNIKTAKSYGFDIVRLLNTSYNLDAGARVLSWFYKTYHRKEPIMWFTRYNCGTKRNINRSTCLRYFKLTSRWM